MSARVVACPKCQEQFLHIPSHVGAENCPKCGLVQPTNIALHAIVLAAIVAVTLTAVMLERRALLASVLHGTLANLITASTSVLVWGWLLGVFGLTFPINPKQKFFSKGLVTDLVYYFFIATIYAPLDILSKVAFARLAIAKVPIHFMAKIPSGYQFVAGMVLVDLMAYWIHRYSHVSPLFWRFHVIHHSSTAPDWWTVSRFHPVNLFLQNSIPIYVLLLAGFKLPVLLGISALGGVIGIIEHANINVSLGPLGRVFVNPVYHRWHHTYMNEGGNKNFAGLFSLLDVAFGTFYMPKGKLPEIYGAEGDAVPKNVMAQLVHPFRSRNS